MKRYVASLLFIFCLSSILAQEKRISNPLFNQGFSLRGKVLGFVIIEDTFVWNWTIGVEYAIDKSRSMGIDFIQLRYLHQQELYDSVSTYYEDSGHSQYERHSIGLIDFRQYFRARVFNATATYYLSAYARVGKSRFWTPDDFPLQANSIISNRYTFHDFGLALGIKETFNPDGRFGIDINLGAHIRNKSGTEWRNRSRELEETRTENDQFWKPSMRVNLFYRFAK